MPYDGAVFVQMRTRPPGAGPFAPMLTAAGWAEASERKWGAGWVLTGSGCLSPVEARRQASRANDEGVLGRTRMLPQPLVTFTKDARAIAMGLVAARAGARGPWDTARVPFVWQRHDAFQQAGIEVADRLGCPLVMAVHAIHVDEAAAWGVRRPLWGRALRYFGELRLLAKADLIACVSPQVAEQVMRYLPGRAKDVVVIGSGIDQQHFRRDAARGQAVRSQLGIPQTSFVFGWHGSFRKFHGLDCLIQAFADARARLPQSHLLLVGHGVHRARLMALAESLGVADFVICPGEIPYDDIPAYLSAMDAGAVLADPGDHFHYSPLKLLEYQASGLPVIASAAGEMKSLKDGMDALVVAPGVTGELANALVRVASSPGLRTTIAANGGELCRRHTWDSKLDELMAELAGRDLLLSDFKRRGARG